MQRRFGIRMIWCVTLAALTGAGCATPVMRPPLTLEEKQKLELAITHDLHLSLEKRLHFKRDAEVQEFLAGIGRKLGEKSAQVILIGDTKRDWRSFGLPEGRVYFPAPLLKKLEFENQVAAVIALELANARARLPFRRLAELRPPEGEASDVQAVLPASQSSWDLTESELLGPGGVFTYRESDLAASTERAVEMLYEAGYDPRGVSSIWRFYVDNPGLSPYERSTTERMEEKSRHAIAQFAPLRNPVIRSQAFLMIQRRIQKL